MRLQLIAFFALVCINFAIDFYIYFRIIRKICRYIWLRISYWGINCLLLAAFLFAYALMKNHQDVDNRMLFIWFMFIYFLVYAPKITYFLLSVWDYVPCLFRKKMFHIFNYIGVVGALFVFGSMAYGAFINRERLVIRELSVESSRLPKGFDNYKIVQISDIHLESFGSDTVFISEMVRQINKLDPDLIVFTGDLVTLRSAELEPFLHVLSGLKAKNGVYSILGNHDYGDYVPWKDVSEKLEDRKHLRIREKEMGWRMLNNESVYLYRGNDSVALIGVENWGEPPFPKYGNLNAAYPDLNDGYFKILLTHNPMHWDEEVISGTNIDLSLSGHTHAMQIKLQLGNWRYSPAAMRYPRWSGLYREGNQFLYVNEGIGCVFMPMRVGATPEITVIRLKCIS